MNYADKQFRDAVAITQDIAIQLGDYVLNLAQVATWFAFITIVLIVVLFVQIKRLAERLEHAENHIEALYDKYFYLKSDVLKLHNDDLS